MDSQEVQLVQAVEIASNAATVTDTSLVSQALAYLEQLKQATDESWSTGWAVWIAREDGHAKYGHAVRLFGLNLVDDFLDKRYVFFKYGDANTVSIRCRILVRHSRFCRSPLLPTCKQSLSQETASKVLSS